MNLDKPKNKLKGLGKRLFSKYFGFETGIDITNDVAVLYRRNVVIKNIVTISNLLYSLVFLILGFSVANPTTDWIFAVASLPMTYAVNKLQDKLMNLDPNDMTKQQVAMYVSSFWIFISAILVYIRIYAFSQNQLFETASYVLIYYALVQISLYQDKRLLSNSFISLIGFTTLIHLAVTYDFFNKGLTWQEFIGELVTENSETGQQFGALILRTVIFILFYLVNFIIVSIGQSIQEERKTELIKRREVQADYTHIVRNLFNVVFSQASSLVDTIHAQMVATIATHLASFYNLDEDLKLDLETYARIHLRFDEIKDLMIDTKYDEQTFDILKTKTELGAKIGRRLQLAQKCNEILRRHYEGEANQSFMDEMNKIQPEIESQIILIADCYVSLRSVSSFHRPNNHQQTLDFFQKQLIGYFDYSLKETFLKFHLEIKEVYENINLNQSF